MQDRGSSLTLIHCHLESVLIPPEKHADEGGEKLLDEAIGPNNPKNEDRRAAAILVGRSFTSLRMPHRLSFLTAVVLWLGLPAC